jgi:PAS domain S-box-containing protein
MSEDELRVSEAKYRNIFENAIDGIFQSTTEGKYLNVNPAFAHMFGFESPQEMISSVADIRNIYVYPAELTKIKDLLLTEGFVRDYVAELRHQDGRRIWGSINAKAVKDKDGRILYYEGTTEDITNRKLNEERLRHINRQLMGIIDFLPDATFVVDKESKVFAWNRAMEELTGLSPEVAIGKGNEVYSKIFYGLQRPILIDSVFQTDSKILEKYSYVERRGYAVYAESFAPMLRNGAGAYLWIVASPLFDEQGNLIGAIETIRDITEKKKVDEEIRKLSKAVESSPNAVIVTDLSGRIEYVNDALPKIGRFSDKHEAIGRSVFEFAAGHEVDLLKNEIIPIILSKGQWSGEMLLCRSDGSTYFADMVWSAIPDERGRPKYLFATFHDISDRKNAEEKLKVTQRQQKAILDNIPDLVWLKDVERRFIAVNDAYGRMLNMKSEELVGKTELDVWPKALAEKYMADDAEVMSFGRRKSTEASVVDRHGRSRWMETIKTPIFDEGGSVVGTAGISRDTTERRNMEEELQEVNRRLNDTIEFFPDATFVIDREGKVLAWNRAIEEMTGVRKEEMVGKGDFTYAMPFYGERRPILLDLVLKSDAGVQDKYTSLTKTGDIIQAEAFATKLFGGVGAYVSITASPLKDEYGEVVGAIEAIRDITEKKKAAEELKAKVDDLERFNKLMVGRELKMIELKREINSILDRLGEPPRYSVPVSEIKKLIAEEKDAVQKNGDGK